MAVSAFEIDYELTPALAEFIASLREVEAAMDHPDCMGKSIFFDVQSNDVVTADDPSAYIKDALGDLNCDDQRKDGQVTRYPGVVEISPEAWHTLHRFNRAKQAMREAVNRCYGLGAKAHELRTAYIRAGLPRLHPLMAWRKINLIEEQPQSIGFTVAQGIDSIARMTITQALSLLEGVGDDVAEQISHYPRDRQLSWHEPTSPHIRANLVWKSDTSTVRKQIQASLPFFVPIGHWPAKRVRWNQPKDTEGEIRKDALKGDRYELPFRTGGFLIVSQ